MLTAMKYRQRRRPTDFDAVLSAESGEYAVKLRDLTPDGVKVAGLKGYVYPEAEISLIVRNQRLPGWISWVNEDVAGVRLKDPLPSNLETLITKGTSFARGPRPARW